MNDESEFEAFRLLPGSVALATAVVESSPRSKRDRNRIPRQTGAFIRGPIPLAWLEVVLRLPGRAPLAVALALVYQSGLEGATTVRFTHKLMQRFRVAPRSASRTLERLQAEGLVRIHRPPGSCREVEILNMDGDVSIDTCDTCSE